MENKRNISLLKPMIRTCSLMICLVSLISSCSGRKNKLDHKELIPEKELIPLIADIYIANGLLSNQNVYQWYTPTDSLESYIDIIEDHGYTKEVVDRTLKYYFIRKPKKLIDIYDQVLGILSEMESTMEVEDREEPEEILNLWNGEINYYFSGKTKTGNEPFDIHLIRKGFYTFSFTATIFPDDQASNNQAVVYTCIPGTEDDGEKIFYMTPVYIKDGLPHLYNITFNITEYDAAHLRGWLYYINSNPDECARHAHFENISLIYNAVRR